MLGTCPALSERGVPGWVTVVWGFTSGCHVMGVRPSKVVDTRQGHWSRRLERGFPQTSEFL